MKLYIAIFVLILLQCNQSFAQGKITMNGATMNIVNTAYVSTNDITIETGGSVIVDSATIKIAGAISNAGIFNLANGTLEMNGVAPQTIPASSITNNILKNLIASNNFSLAGEDSVTGTLSFGASDKSISTGGFLTLKSTVAATARLADITNAGANSGNTITGSVHVERYIQSHRAWRLLTSPTAVSGAQTIKAAWQEGQTGVSNSVPGYGTHITGGSTANGFDQGVNPNNIGVKEYVGGVWAALPNTTVRKITDQPGYFVFFRGNRSTNLSQGVYAPPSSSVLRSTGVLKINNQSFAVAATGFTLVSNPYASAININQIAKSLPSNNIKDVFYFWDPKLTGSNGVGAYVTISWNGGSYDVAPPSVSGLNQYVQSGSAFFAVSANGSSPGTLVIKETDKSTVNMNANRPPNNSTGKLRTNLYSYNADGTISLVDGTLNSYGDIYSNSIDQYDAVKLKNTNESLFTVRDGISLVVERKQPVTESDTIFLNMQKMQAKSYKFELVADNFYTAGLTGVLEDSFTNIKTILDLTGTTVYNYTVVNVPGSWNPNRFRVVFTPLNVLPVTITRVRAFEQNGNIKVEWLVQNEFNIKQYEVETSADGQTFVKATTVMAAGNTSASNYNWLDENALAGYNYYRIKSIGINGQIKYSSVMKVYMGTDKPNIQLVTNVITNKTITFQMNNMPQGIYAVSVTNNLGQVMYRKNINHPEGSSTENIQLNDINFTTGIYHLSIIKPDLIIITMQLLME